MNVRWFIRPDWPLEHELRRREALIAAIRNIPGGETVAVAEVEGQALLLFSTSNFGRNDEMPRNRPASRAASEAELRKLHDLCDKLKAHIDQLHHPAVAALLMEGCNVFTLGRQVADAQERARQAFGQLDAPRKVAGARTKIEAEEVSMQAGLIYEHVTGKRPTCTTDPATGEITGVWPDFLSKVFSALQITASVSSQAKGVSKLMRSESPPQFIYEGRGR